MSKKKESIIDTISFNVLQGSEDARNSIKNFHKEAFFQIYGFRADEFFDLIFSKKYNFFSYDRTRIKIQKKFPSLSSQWSVDEHKKKYIQYARTPLEIIEFGGLKCLKN